MASNVVEGATITGLGYLADRSAASYATAISGDGLVVVGYVEAVVNYNQGRRAFRWSRSEGMLDLGVLTNAFADTDHSMAFAVSGDGTVIGGQSNFEGFRWKAASGLSGISFLPGNFASSSIQAASANGETLVGYAVTRAF